MSFPSFRLREWESEMAVNVGLDFFGDGRIWNQSTGQPDVWDDYARLRNRKDRHEQSREHRQLSAWVEAILKQTRSVDPGISDYPFTPVYPDLCPYRYSGCQQLCGKLLTKQGLLPSTDLKYWAFDVQQLAVGKPKWKLGITWNIEVVQNPLEEPEEFAEPVKNLRRPSESHQPGREHT